MDNLIQDYVLTRFVPEMQNELFRSFRLFSDFNYVDSELPFINLLMAEDLNETQELQDQFIHILLGQQDYIYKAHLLSVSEHTTVQERNEVLQFLLSIQNLENYHDIEAILHCTQDKMHALSMLCSKLTILNEHRCMEILLDFDETAYRSLVSYVSKQAQLRNSTTVTYTEKAQDIIANMKSFVAFTKQDNLLGRVLMDSSVLLDQPIPRYKNFIDSDIFKHKEPHEIALDILSLLYLTYEGSKNPLQAYRDNVSLFFTDLPTIGRIEHEINNVLAQYTTFLKVEDEKARLLQASRKA